MLEKALAVYRVNTHNVGKTYIALMYSKNKNKTAYTYVV